MSKNSLQINRTLLITLVRKRPAIWDKTMTVYKCKRAKAQAWHEICLALNKDYEGIDQNRRKEYFKQLVRTWTHIRDSWMKSMKDKRNEKELIKPYIYHDQLLFLKKIIISRDVDAPTTKEEAEQEEESSDEENEYEHTGTSYFSMEIQDMIENDSRREMSKKSLVINRPLLINLVRERPAIWDKTSDIYKNKRAKSEAWRDICLIMNEYYEQMSQSRRKQYFKLLVSVWTQVRDTWMRSVKNNSSRPYKHHEKMLFLKKIITSTEVLQNIASTSQREQQENTMDDEENDNESIDVSVDEREYPCFNDSQTTNLRPQNEPEDRNYLFFKSIQPTLAYFNDDQILEFQAGTINLLQRIKTGPNYNEFQQQPVPSARTSQVAEEASSGFILDPIKIETYDIT